MTAPIPIAQHKLRGTYRSDRHGGGVEFEPGGRPAKPEGLSDAAAAFWEQHIEPLAESGVVAATDQAACESAAHWWGELRRQAAQAASGPTGDKYYWLATLCAAAQKQFNGIAQRLGPTPYDRRRVRASAHRPGVPNRRSSSIKRADDLADKSSPEQPKDKWRFFTGVE